MKEILIKKRRAPFLTGILLLASALFIYRCYIFGDELWVFVGLDIGSDTVQQYLQHYHTIVNHIREGTFTFWDFNNGFGTNMFNLNMFDPTLMIIYALGAVFGPEHIAWYLVYMQVIRIVLAGIVFYHYLSCFSFSGKTKCIISYIYGLNGFLMVWGQHYQFGMAVVYLPLLLWAVERCLRRQRFHAPMVLAVWLVTVYSTYLGYMMFVCLGFYILVRLFGMQEQLVCGKWRMLGLLYGSMLLGIGMGAVTMFPTAFTIFGISGRMESQRSLLSRLGHSLLPYSPHHYKVLFYKFFSSYLEGLTQVTENNIFYTGSTNYYEDPNLFCSTLFLVLGCQYVCCLPRMPLSKKQKGLRFGLLGLLVFCTALPFTGLVMNGFASTINRHTFLMMPFFCLIMAQMLNTLIQKQLYSRLGSAGAFLLIIFVCIRKYPSVVFLSHKQNLLILTITGMLMVIVLVCLGRCRKKSRQTGLCAVLFCLVIANMVSEGYTSTLERLTLRKDNAQYWGDLYDQDVQNALAWLEEKDSQFYRVEKDFDVGSICMDSLAQGYRGVSTYNSTINRYILDFTANLYPDFWSGDKNHYRFRMIKQEHEFADLCGIRYLLSRGGEENDPFDKKDYRLVKEFGKIQIYENRNDTSLGRFYADAASRQEFDQYLEENGRQTAQDYIMEHVVLEGLPEDALTHGTGNASAKAVSIEAPKKDNHLTGTIKAPQDGYVMFAIPFEKGWSIYVDGEKQEILKANLGFQGIAVKEGTHQVELKYQAPGFLQGLAVSILCWSVFLGLVYYFYYKEKPKKNQKG